MRKFSMSMKAIEYSAGWALGASFGVLILATVAFGYPLARWTEWQGELVGIVGTIAGVVGAVVGSRRAFHEETHRHGTTAHGPLA